MSKDAASDAPVDSLKNIGPASAEYLRAIGIETVGDLREAGAVLAYKILKHRFPSNIGPLSLYALEGALTGRHWNSFSAEEKTALLGAIEGDLEIGSG